MKNDFDYRLHSWVSGPTELSKCILRTSNMWIKGYCYGALGLRLPGSDYDEVLVDEAMEEAARLFGQGSGYVPAGSYAEAVEHMQKHANSEFIRGYRDANSDFQARVAEGKESLDGLRDALGWPEFTSASISERLH